MNLLLTSAKKSVENTLLKNEVLETYPHLTVIKSISKSYGVPGLRLGIAASSDKEIISYLRKNIGYMEYKLLRRILFTDIQQV